MSFRNLLELVPEVREAVYDFYASRYASCLRLLEGLKKSLQYDLYLHRHVEALCRQIRERALVQYTIPFTSVVMQNMATAFNTNVESLEKEIASLIAKGQINARVDSHNKILYGRHANQRNLTLQQVEKAGDEYEHNSEAILLRASLLQYNLVQQASHGGKPGAFMKHRGEMD